MVIFGLMAIGAVGVVAAWWLVRARGVSVWAAAGWTIGVVGTASVLTGRIDLSPRVSWPVALAAGVGAGVALYGATTLFVLVVRRWPVFDRHVAEIYDQRKGLALPAALLLVAVVIGPGEELFWRGLFQGRLAQSFGWPLGAVATWAAYVGANAASRSLPILAGAIVSGAVWGGLALWTHGVLASLLCHAAWTALMVAAPPGGPRRRTPRR